MDTNQLLRIFVVRDLHSPQCRRAFEILRRQNVRLYLTLQNASEFWNTCTRPVDNNGLAMSPREAAHSLDVLLTQFEVLPDTLDVFQQWRTLAADYDVRGVQAHDARLVASMLVHRIPAILTQNLRHFRRYTEIQVVGPEEVIAWER